MLNKHWHLRNAHLPVMLTLRGKCAVTLFIFSWGLTGKEKTHVKLWILQNVHLRFLIFKVEGYTE